MNREALEEMAADGPRLLVRRIPYLNEDGMGFVWAVALWRGERSEAGGRVITERSMVRVYGTHAKALQSALETTDHIRRAVRARLS